MYKVHVFVAEMHITLMPEVQGQCNSTAANSSKIQLKKRVRFWSGWST